MPDRAKVSDIDMELSFESTATTTQPQFAAWVEERQRWDLNRYELLNGRVVMNPPAGYPHGEVESNVVAALVHVVKQRGAGRVFGSSQGFELPSGDTVEPDASFVSTERWEAMRAAERGRFLRVAPDLVVEILSNATRTRDRGEKKAIYERNGVREYWLIDDESREVRVFRLEGERYDLGTVHEQEDAIESSVLDACFAVRDLLV